MRAFLFSTERFEPQLPVAGKVIRPAQCRQRDDAVFFVVDKGVAPAWPSTLLVVPKCKGNALVSVKDGVLFAFILDGTKLLNAEPIDLTSLRSKVLDWGGLARTFEDARRWQFKEADAAASKEVLAVC